MLPLVQAIASDMAELSKRLVERQQSLQQLMAGRTIDPEGPCDPYTEELAQIEQELKLSHQQLQAYAEELIELGLEPKGGPEGLVDFPSEMDGRLVYLCWKIGEPEVAHWHDLDAGFAGRQPLIVASAFGEDPHH